MNENAAQERSASEFSSAMFCGGFARRLNIDLYQGKLQWCSERSGTELEVTSEEVHAIRLVLQRLSVSEISEK